MEIQISLDTSTGYPWARRPHQRAQLLPREKDVAKTTSKQPKEARDTLNQMMLAVAQHRDRSAFVELFRHFAPRIKGYLCKLGADQTAADGLVQDVMLTVWNRAHQFDPKKAAISTWIFTIARNRRIDVLRRERRPEIDPNDPLLVPSPETPSDEILDANRASGDLKQAVAKLPADQASLLSMAFFEDKSHSVIAAEMALPLGTVKSRLRLALAKLRSAIRDTE